MDKVTITRIPYPSKILNGSWNDHVYAIYTVSESLADHVTEVDSSVRGIKKDFDDDNHYSVSLREVKRELVVQDERMGCYLTLVQFRIRDSY